MSSLGRSWDVLTVTGQLRLRDMPTQTGHLTDALHAK